jgi:hypothetical protein
MNATIEHTLQQLDRLLNQLARLNDGLANLALAIEQTQNPARRATSPRPSHKHEPQSVLSLPDDHFLTVREIAAFVRCHENFVYERMRREDLPSSKLGGKRYSTVLDVRNWLNQCRQS